MDGATPPSGTPVWISFGEETYTFTFREWRKAGRVIRRITNRHSIAIKTRRTVQVSTRKYRARKGKR